MSRDIANFSDVLRVRAAAAPRCRSPPSLYQRVLRGAVARRTPGGVRRPRIGSHSGGATATATSKSPRSDPRGRRAYQQIVGRKGKALGRVGGGRTHRLLHVDRSGAENIWSASVGSGRAAEHRQVTRFAKGGCCGPQSRVMAAPWRSSATRHLDAQHDSGDSREVPIRRIGAPAAAGWTTCGSPTSSASLRFA